MDDDDWLSVNVSGYLSELGINAIYDSIHGLFHFHMCS